LLENGLQILDCKNHNPYFVLSTSEIPLKIYKVFKIATPKSFVKELVAMVLLLMRFLAVSLVVLSAISLVVVVVKKS
jgi:hypothetical protein